MPNRLQHESSLYLRQHAENPVDWYPYGEEALARAAAESKPILVSIGYSACHWCHVMAHESFEDAYIAGLMNEHFVCIKIDREERPDLDHFYMEAVQMMNGGHGGWPLNVFCLPDGRPFAGGTYFPPDDRRGGQTVPWPQLLVRVSDYFKRSRADLEENAVAVLKNLRAGNQPVAATGDPITPVALLKAAEVIAEGHDDEFGGFGGAPKFPPAMTLDFLLAMRGARAVEEARPSLARRLDAVINTTLTAMAHGGLFDQIGGGFSRYCVDRSWVIPHFEKMLYDNGLLLSIYSRAYRRYPKPVYAAIVAETIDWLEREMASPQDCFYSALDADSEGEEGRFYVWTPEEVAAVLGDERGAAFCEAYGITEEGNFEQGASQALLLAPDFETRVALAEARAQLLAARAGRVRPGRDQKQLVSWNALAVIGLSEAAWTFGRQDWMKRAKAAVDALWERHVTTVGDRVRLARGSYGESAFGEGVLDDYAGLAEACLAVAAYIDWIEPGANATYRRRAELLAAAVEERFRDAEALGYYFTDTGQKNVLQRKKEWFDNAVPSGHAHLVQVVRDLGQLTGDAVWSERLERLSAAYPGYAERAPQAVAHALSGLVQAATGVATIQVPAGADLEALRAALVARPWRRVYVQVHDSADRAVGFQLCVGTQCLAPTSDPDALAELL